jgi:alpha-beta hydrolase superfamily lysophospholipase
VIHETGFFDGAGGRRIFWQRWLPDDAVRATVVLVHGASEHSDRYQHVAAGLVTAGYAVYASDHRGHGRSDGPRAVIDRLDNAVADVDQLVTMARQEGEAPVFMLGHSMGGTVALAYAVRLQVHLAGVILSGALAALEAAPLHLRLAGRVLSVVAPNLPLIPIDASLVSRDPDVVKAYVADPLVHHGKLPARTVAELADAIDGFPDAVGAITIPTLILYGTADRIVPPAGSQMVAERIGSSDTTVKAYPDLFHEILNEPEQVEVLADIVLWLDAHVTGTTPDTSDGESADSISS